jgi:MFS family permease
MTTLAPGPSTSLRRQRPFVLFWCARVAATTAFEMQAVAVGWQIYDLTGSPFDLGLVGLLRSAPALGALASSILLSRHPLRRRVGRILFAVVMGFGAATAVFAVSTSLALSLVALALCRAFDAVSVVIRFSLVQTRTPSEMRGRVSSVNSLFVGASVEDPAEATMFGKAIELAPANAERAKAAALGMQCRSVARTRAATRT